MDPAVSVAAWATASEAGGCGVGEGSRSGCGFSGRSHDGSGIGRSSPGRSSCTMAWSLSSPPLPHNATALSCPPPLVPQHRRVGDFFILFFWFGSVGSTRWLFCVLQTVYLKDASHLWVLINAVFVVSVGKSYSSIYFILPHHMR